MKKSPFYLLQLILEIFKKKSRSGEKEQDIEMKKLNVFNPYISYIAIILLLICFLDALFPKIATGDWFYEMLSLIHISDPRDGLLSRMPSSA